MKKILLLTTGGTIASESSEHGLVPAGHNFLKKYDYKEAYRRLYGNQHTDRTTLLRDKNDRDTDCDADIKCDICVKTLMNIDSTNMTPNEWHMIAKGIYEGLTDVAAYDGIVVTHGTDTMAYTLAAMGYCLQNIKKPVIFTGAQKPMGQPDSDAEKNLTDAITAALFGLCGIYLVFGAKIIDSRYAKKVYAKQRTAFESINHADAGYIKEDGTVHVDAVYADGTVMRTTSSEQTDETILRTMYPAAAVACIKLLPGQSADVMEYFCDKGYHAVILEGFGCGGIPDNEFGWLAAIKKAVEAGMTVYIQSSCTYDGTDISVYEVGQKAQKAGALCAEDMTIEALYVKLISECENFP